MSTALYRRYRPETFAEVIGQEHVTEPLMAALRADRVSHAYLFSGPRGCGKTSSARILARCLNCEQGPTDTPCGTCPSCIELARGGPGSLDVVEMDAASHGGVDDARDLRERAAFAPARDRYKVFIIDEAHMVTTQGFNALLKLVEEPPEHVKFVFATTEPDKVIGTIRSRTHHYPFRLVPPGRLQAYLQEVCDAEGVHVEAGVLPLVVRAGGGSVRDSLSVLDQLTAGAVEGRLDYHRALALLGYTDAALLDDAMDALAARDGASLFRVIDRVVETGHDPRRFVEDLLQRLRDVVLIAIAGEPALATLPGLPEDQVARMRTQANHLGAARASRSADLVNDALTEMGGATSPRLHLELLAARLLLPAPDAAGLGARLERLEQQVATGAAPEPGAAPAPGAASGPAAAAVPPPAASSDGAAPRTAEPAPARPAPAEPHAGGAPAGARPASPVERPSPGTDGADDRDRREAGPAAGRPVQPAAGERAPDETPALAGEPVPTAGPDADLVRRRWPEVVATLARLRRSTWALVSQNAQVASVSEGVLRLSFATAGLASTFRSGPHAGPVQQALAETLGVQLRVEAVVDDGGSGGWGGWDGPGGGPPPTPEAPGPVETARASWGSPPDAPSAGTPGAAGPAAGVRAGTVATAATVGVLVGAGARGYGGLREAPSARSSALPPDALPARAPAPTPGTPDGLGTDSASPAYPPDPPTPVAPEDDEPSMDDPDAGGSGLVGVPLVVKVLGATIIEDGPVGPEG